MASERNLPLRLATSCALVTLVTAAGLVLLPGPSAPVSRSHRGAFESSERPARAETGERTRSRRWRRESLPELEFDQALTLLGAELERLAARKVPADELPAAFDTAIGPIVAELENAHRANRERITAARTFYESLSPEALGRFEEFERRYEERYRAMRSFVRDVRSGRLAAAAELVAFLRKIGAWRPPRTVPEPENLPRRRLEPAARAPRLTEEAWGRKGARSARADAPRTLRARSLLDDLFGVRIAHAQDAEDPEGDDLGETTEVLLDPQRAPLLHRTLDDEGLGGSPARIVAWVRDNIEFVPIWGSIQSSETCLETRRGTAMDIASVTIAMLRASGIRARYQAGTVRMPIDEAMNWLGGFTDAHAAASLLASGGTPAVVQVGEGGEPVALRFEHVWVKAFVDWVPSRGACHVEGDAWLDVDASVRQHVFASRPDLTRFISPASVESRYAAHLDRLEVDERTGEVSGSTDVLQEPALPDLSEGEMAQFLDELGAMTASDFCGIGRPIASDPRSLVAAPPFQILARGEETAALEPSDRFGLTIRLRGAAGDLLTWGTSLAELGDARLSIGFDAESEVDLEIVEARSAGEALNVVGVRVVPTLLADGARIQSGSPVDLGTPLELVIDYEEPVLDTPPIVARIVAGEVTAIGLDAIAVPLALLERIGAQVEEMLRSLESPPDDWNPSVFVEGALSLMVHGWFAQVDQSNTLLGSLAACVTHRYPSAGFSSAKWTTRTLFGLPFEGRDVGLSLDIPGDVNLLLSREGDRERMATVNRLQGFHGSRLEGELPMQLLHSDEVPVYWLSSTTALASALEIGDRLLLVSPVNADDAISRLRLAVDEVEEIREAARAGLSVFTHTNALRDRRGCYAGYVMFDPETGNGIYRVSGGLCGNMLLKCVDDANFPPGRPQSVFNSPPVLWAKDEIKRLLSESYLTCRRDGLSIETCTNLVLSHATAFISNSVVLPAPKGSPLRSQENATAAMNLAFFAAMVELWSDPDSPMNPNRIAGAGDGPVVGAVNSARFLVLQHVWGSYMNVRRWNIPELKSDFRIPGDCLSWF